MIRFFKNLFKGKDPGPVPEAPYKVEAPVETGPAKCGCGRSQSGNCVGLHKLTPEEWAAHVDNPNAAKPVKKKRTFVKRNEGAVAKPKTAAKPKPKAAKPKAK